MLKLFSFIKKALKINKNETSSLDNADSTTKEEQKSISINPINTTTMSSGLYNYGIGGNEVKVDASEAIQEIQGNKTLIAQKLTDEDPLNPEAVYDLKTVEDVFNYFKPNVNIEFEDQDGQTINEHLKFKHLGDFTARNITEQSEFLKDLNIQKDQYAKIVKQLKSNKVLKAILENPETRAAFTHALQALSNELDQEEN
ncbi:type VI secretion system contractile sheath small subunit [Cytophagaceae bacterium DM2B3-1]|uniref:Type VI secretion system contractile sheath small subunit n=2 Tax=Xanthocytophaga flava TaxID=3048013 RepID=A0ABT7CIQ8_9BACT|nr:type VI secretion system contractile sheath small subunit [Xanthocytophaga flavus]